MKPFTTALAKTWLCCWCLITVHLCSQRQRLPSAALTPPSSRVRRFRPLPSTPVHTNPWLRDEPICHPDSSQMACALAHFPVNNVHVWTGRIYAVQSLHYPKCAQTQTDKGKTIEVRLKNKIWFSTNEWVQPPLTKTNNPIFKIWDWGSPICNYTIITGSQKLLKNQHIRSS